MEERQWTTPQKNSIEAQGGSLLVSAAAGSGKTAVLVERVIRRITDDIRPVDVNRLLIVTFTRAAAAEMRQRLTEALNQCASEDPNNPLYQRQQMLLPNASIETVDGFCSRLLREQAARAGLPPRFRVLEEGEAELLRGEALDEVLEEAYQQQDAAFIKLTEQLGGQKNDNNIREAILQATDFMQAQPFPEQWLQQQMDAYTAITPLGETVWFRSVCQRSVFELEQQISACRNAQNIASQYGIDAYLPALKEDEKMIESLLTAIREAPYEELSRLLAGVNYSSLNRFKPGDESEAQAQESVKNIRDSVKDGIKKVQEWLLYDEDEYRRDLAELAPVVEALGRLVFRYIEIYHTKKRAKKCLDYADLEHESLRLLLDSESGQRTALAQELSLRYDEIMVDEYQDTNAAQDALFRALSRDETNLFLVGDVKQSIYGFRQAMPEIFNRRRTTYVPYEEENPFFPATITLEDNFRSRRPITDTVNFLFRQLMHASLGGVEYDEREELKYAALYKDTENPRTEWALLNHGEKTNAADCVVSEARWIAARIRRQMREQTVKTRDGARALEYGDICILLRSIKNAPIYQKELEKWGIPVSSSSGGGLLQTAEVMTAVSFLRVLDNPLLEVELVAVMLSPLYGFTPDECAVLRQDKSVKTLYAALEKESQNQTALSKRCALLLGDLRRLRLLAVSLPVDRLLERIDREIGLTDVFAARNGGRQRVANLHQLDQVARGFEQGEFRGLSAFVRYLDRLEELGKDLVCGDDLRADGVRIMTIHASKGLEFPVVYLAQMGKKFNDNDFKASLLFHHRAGIGLRRRDSDTLEKHKTLPFKSALAARSMDDCAEEMRVWYVALTRAKEQLCLVFSLCDVQKQLKGKEDLLPVEEAFSSGWAMQAKCPADWFLSAALRHPSFAFLRNDPQKTVSLPAKEEWTVLCVDASDLPTEEVAERTAVTVEADEETVHQMQQRVDYVYPFMAVSSAPAKLAASQLSHEAMHHDRIAQKRPAFLQKEGMDAAEKGTALHTFMQFADFACGSVSPTEEADRLLSKGFITKRQRDVLPMEKIQRFFESRLFARMQVSSDCRREFPFTVPIPAVSSAGEPLPDGENTVVQGIADCVFREGDGLVLVDYKTDRVKTPDELKERYRSQMEFYRTTLEIIFGCPVKETILYSFALEQEVRL